MSYYVWLQMVPICFHFQSNAPKRLLQALLERKVYWRFANDSIDYDNFTYGDILSTIKKLGINTCNDEKLLKYQLKNKRKAKYEIGNFCEQYGLPPIAPSRQKGKKHDKSHKNYNHKKYKTNFVKPNDFYAKKKNCF